MIVFSLLEECAEESFYRSKIKFTYLCLLLPIKTPSKQNLYMKKFFISASFLLLVIPASGSNYHGLFPDLPGWDKPSDIKVYTPDNLWNIIDGAADSYLSYNFEELYTGDYTNSNGNYMSVEMYRHDSPENAFGIYTAEKPSGVTLIKTGTEAYTGEDFFNFLCGNYYVKIHASENSQVMREAMARLGAEIAKKIGGPTSLPFPLGWFPEEGKIADSESYINTNFLGFSFLQKAFTAQYQSDGKNFTLFIIALQNQDDAKQMLQNYLRYLKQNEQPFEGRHNINDPYNGTIDVILQGPVLLGIYNCKDESIRNKYLWLLLSAVSK